MSSRRFAPHWIPTLAAMAVVAIGLALGQWQMGRASQKQTVADKAAQGAAQAPVSLPATVLSPQAAALLDLQPVTLKGEYVASATVFIDNRVYKRQPGYHVVTPLKLSGSSMHVIVNRGWVPANLDRAVLPNITIQAGEVTVRGMARVPVKAFALAPAQAGEKVWPSLALERFSTEYRLAVQPVYAEQSAAGAPQDGLVRDWPSAQPAHNAAAHGMTPDKHRGYAFQWFSLAALAAVLWLVFSFKAVPQ
jgi:surfeit locus 1 family protein